MSCYCLLTQRSTSARWTVTLLAIATTKITRKAAQSVPSRTADGVERCRNRKPTWRDGCPMLTSIFRIGEIKELLRMWGGQTAAWREISRRKSEYFIVLKGETTLDTDVWKISITQPVIVSLDLATTAPCIILLKQGLHMLLIGQFGLY